MTTCAWHDMVRRRLLAGEEIDGPMIRREVGRRIGIYTFLRQLEEREGWILQQRLVESRHMPTIRFKLAGFREVEPPTIGPRTDLPHDQRPAEIIRRRFLAGEELENKAIAEELGCVPAMVTYVKRQLEADGYESVTRREQYRVFTRFKRRRKRAS